MIVWPEPQVGPPSPSRFRGRGLGGCRQRGQIARLRHTESTPPGASATGMPSSRQRRRGRSQRPRWTFSRAAAGPQAGSRQAGQPCAQDRLRLAGGRPKRILAKSRRRQRSCARLSVSSAQSAFQRGSRTPLFPKWATCSFHHGQPGPAAPMWSRSWPCAIPTATWPPLCGHGSCLSTAPGGIVCRPTGIALEPGQS